MSFVLVWSDIQ